ncbi:MAG: site-2 protease family protein [Bernardetiaceae bacterium]
MRPLLRLLLHPLLFLLTFIATTFAGAEWIWGRPFFWVSPALTWAHFWDGLHYSIPFLGILTVHEFGHYFVAQYHRLRVSLPYYIPLWLGFLPLFAGAPSIGTMGAFIRIRSRIWSRKVYFDVGIAGPLAGFVVALGVLWYGFTFLPPAEHIFEIHPEYAQYGLAYADHVYQDAPEGGVRLGTNLLFEAFKYWVADPALLPNDFEIMHYPYLLAGYLALFFTALNLLPIGQLDGGHVLYGLVGYRWHQRIARLFFFVFLGYAGLGLFSVSDVWESPTGFILYVGYLYWVWAREFRHWQAALVVALVLVLCQWGIAALFPGIEGYHAWLLFGFLLGRVVGISHPGAEESVPLSPIRKALGVLALVVFVLCFTPQPLLMVE